jgi:hypothetical protein
MSSANEKHFSVSRFACFDILSAVVKHIGLDFLPVLTIFSFSGAICNKKLFFFFLEIL